MRLPDRLREAINAELERADRPELSRAVVLLTENYEQGRFGKTALATPILRLAYLAVRLPGTFASNLRVLGDLRERCPEPITSMLDIGSGPGTALWAAGESYPAMEKFTAAERDSELIELGRRLAFHSDIPALRATEWVRLDVAADMSLLQRHDLVVLSYVVGEMSSAAAVQVVRRAWALAGKCLVLIEPGTPRNFERVIAARQQLVEMGAHVVAPCPHSLACPLNALGDWCHFSQRLERTSEHRQLKGGTLGYEDEKFSYFIASKSETPLPDSRIVRHPLKRPGHVQLTLCTPQGLQKATVGKSRKADYKRARKAEWGDAWERGPDSE